MSSVKLKAHKKCTKITPKMKNCKIVEFFKTAETRS